MAKHYATTEIRVDEVEIGWPDPDRLIQVA
jgi:hypothetical protein